MPERIRVVGMAGDVPVAHVEGDLITGGRRHLAAVAPAGAPTVAIEGDVRAVPARTWVVGMAGDMPVAPAAGHLITVGRAPLAAVAPAGTRTVAIESDEVVTRA